MNEFGSLLTMESCNCKSKVEEAIQESPDLVSALECVGAMYGIPSTNILVDNELKGIRIINDHIVTPNRRDASANTKSIICAIGGVLDFISQRIDEKLDAYQNENIRHGRIIDDIAMHENPEKGTIIARYEDSDGNAVYAFDTGMVDAPSTECGRVMVKSLRDKGMIPDYNPDAVAALREKDYFAEDEDIMEGVEDNTDIGLTNDISEEIQESALMMEIISSLHDTRNLGYDLLQRQGFDYVKPVNSFIQESADVKKKADEKKKGKEVTVKDIKYMKFDNSELMKAVRLLNKCRAELIQEATMSGEERAKGLPPMDYQKFLNHKLYNEAIDCLDKQFNARINIKYERDAEYQGTVGTLIMDDIKKNLSISKSKGFQLNQMNIDIVISDNIMELLIPKEASLFGQGFVSIILHEIFHNIADALRESTLTASIQLQLAIDAARKARDSKTRRMILERYVNSVDNGTSIFSKAQKKSMVKSLCILVSLQDNHSALKELEAKAKSSKDPNNANDMVDLLISAYKKEIERVRNQSPEMKKYKVTKGLLNTSMIMLHISLWVIVAMVFGIGPANILGKINFVTTVGGLAFMLLGIISNFGYQKELKRVNTIRSEYRSAKLYEEYYCDLFASMYQLPVVFFIGYSKKHVPNDVDKKRLQELSKVEALYTATIMDTHPTNTARNVSAVKTAKQMLGSSIKMDPESKKYCQWIVDNFSKLDDPDISKNYNSNLYDPKEAEDLDKHMELLIKNSNILLTESFMQWMNHDTVYSD